MTVAQARTWIDLWLRETWPEEVRAMAAIDLARASEEHPLGILEAGHQAFAERVKAAREGA